MAFRHRPQNLNAPKNSADCFVQLDLIQQTYLRLAAQHHLLSPAPRWLSRLRLHRQCRHSMEKLRLTLSMLVSRNSLQMDRGSRSLLRVVLYIRRRYCSKRSFVNQRDLCCLHHHKPSRFQRRQPSRGRLNHRFLPRRRYDHLHVRSAVLQWTFELRVQAGHLGVANDFPHAAVHADPTTLGTLIEYCVMRPCVGSDSYVHLRTITLDCEVTDAYLQVDLLHWLTTCAGNEFMGR